MDPKDYGIYTDNIVIGIHSGKTAIIDKMKKMSLNFENYDIDKIVFGIKKYFETNNSIIDDEFLRIVKQYIIS